MLAIIDYGVGNLYSLYSSFLAATREPVIITNTPEDITAADKLVLPGVGAFEDAIKKLRESGLDEVVKKEAAKGKPLLGICLGMQLLFDKSYEYGEHWGLGLIPGEIRPISEIVPEGLKIPHIGWNALLFKKARRTIPLFKYIKKNDCMYFVHSYSARECQGSVIASCEYGVPLVAAVARGNVYGCQFHPEKSGRAGINILRAFCEMQ